ncbi:hypothetical protein JEQ12_009378 [Ovis aries]|uniref:Uncharacterized protein n=1 Tax=Ovis aries TaxID=9940 RepID=A0A836D917_SHEEP|nr:hypothetical protein JEQ12_009378 [Ovis aries]
MSETSSHDSFYDSLSDLLEDGENAAFFPGLSAFLSQEEIHKSLDLARRAIASSKPEDCDCEEVLQRCSPSPRSRRKPLASPEARRGERASPGTPGDRRRAPAVPPPVEQAECISSPASRRKAGVSPLLARPSYIRSLRKAGKQVAKAPGASAKPRAARPGRAGPQSPLNDKAATLIEELTSIFREAAKPRTRSPDGESSSPDSGYLSPKNQPSDPRSASASRSPTRGRQDSFTATGTAILALSGLPSFQTLLLPFAEFLQDILVNRSGTLACVGVLPVVFCGTAMLFQVPKNTWKEGPGAAILRRHSVSSDVLVLSAAVFLTDGRCHPQAHPENASSLSVKQRELNTLVLTRLPS